MNPLVVAAVLVGLVALATGLGLVWQRGSGRVREADATRVTLPELPEDGQVTLLQFSTEFCSTCGPTRRVLGDLAGQLEGVRHVDVDLTHRPELAARFNILQTPTTLILDGAGVIRGRIGGAPRRDDVRTAVEGLLVA
ncbi:TlpA family protein disulfide reductase [Galbitalea soli]|uniref:Thioredoxin family protein n=1 Tax=Galbitalea soli TaxID=1268042 RepID=A0A7C9TP74_9MICO|nr:thioredoxin family protein [Galbitalea soli]NEM90355.1 thioredoxin family protein [Galbitalea soli]NYJ31065.1 thiol-disulfide isomerase/thioredoxin [Galbitalea soli]